MTTNDHSLKRQNEDIDSFEDSDGDSVSETWKGNNTSCDIAVQCKILNLSPHTNCVFIIATCPNAEQP